MGQIVVSFTCTTSFLSCLAMIILGTTDVSSSSSESSLPHELPADDDDHDHRSACLSLYNLHRISDTLYVYIMLMPHPGLPASSTPVHLKGIIPDVEKRH
jgi:hypothetical protein